ncbi:zinc-binding dehydrogenase [Chitinophaga pendula]|uniref:zinc-binding dehydrogenase n=1 Tax=Chitinophaga TaxID=79328 RepID=UPI000BAEE85E|nr:MULTISPECIES: zinc-binding dehydrogenase [Chitinophaga]ASZ11820.1 alcohol dehydrogenase [Chitinophaga sp. MD30]UCJ05159.1 zinc-binding dehydrogenase [Chitinophaga pendula]
MKAVVLNGIDQPLELEELPMPVAAPGEAVVKIQAAAFNKRDWWIQKGQYAGLKFPIVLGSDGSGTVHSVGDEKDNTWIGKEVVILPSLNWGSNEAVQQKSFTILGLPEAGTFAEYVKVPVQNLFNKPAHLTFEQAAAFPLSGLTAFRALFVKGQWQPGEKVLISGVGGGAGSFALQWAVNAGADTYVTSGSREKIEQAIALGAKGGVNYRDADWKEQLAKQAGAFDVIIDSALGDGFENLVALAAPGGRIVFFGGTAGNIPAINGRPIFWKQLSILGTTMGSPKDFQAMLDFIDQYKIIPIVDEVLPLAHAEDAVRLLDNDSSRFGKVVLEV